MRKALLKSNIKINYPALNYELQNYEMKGVNFFKNLYFHKMREALLESNIILCLVYQNN